MIFTDKDIPNKYNKEKNFRVLFSDENIIKINLINSAVKIITAIGSKRTNI